MTSLADRSLERSQHFTFPRRELLQKLASVALLSFVPRSQQLFSFCQTPKPEFWFGDRVDFFWTDETSGDRHSETREIAGTIWNYSNKQWEYTVVWVSSTAYPDEDYPYSDGRLLGAGELCKH